ncbi:MAG: hypothetical protein AAF563_14915 [Pseudomonadota bacterium]
MSTKTAAAVQSNPMEGHGLRLMIAVVLAMIAGVIHGDFLVVFMGPVFVTMFAVPDGPAPTLTKAAVIALLVWVTGLATSGIGDFFSNHQSVLVLFFAAGLFACFMRDALVGPSPVIGLVLVVMVVAGTMSANFAPLAKDVINALPVAVLFSMIAIMFAHAIVPSTADETGVEPPGEPADAPVRDALMRTAILLPLIIWFLATGKVGSFYILIVAISVLRVPKPETVALALVAANFLGGAVALVAATLIFITPSPLFGVIVLALMALGLGLMVEQGGVRGKLAGAASGPAMIMLMLALSVLDGSDVYISRVLEIAASVLYVLLAMALLSSVARKP